MNVKNRKCIRKLSFKTLWASCRRNGIAVIAIVLTALMFTSLFTVTWSINSSYQTYTFRQIGGYSHGTFKDVTKEQAGAIAGHPKVKEVGERKVIGFSSEGIFAKVPAEISYMDENSTRWSYAWPDAGRLPEKENEVMMDTETLRLLGIRPELGSEINLTYTVGDKNQVSFEKTDSFILVGYWEYDEISPVHYINISKEYAQKIEAEGRAMGMKAFRTDLNVMMASSLDIRGEMEQVDTDLGYSWETWEEENSVRIGVNWGYTTAQLNSGMDVSTMLSIIAFLALVIFTGYLIIYNIFQISVNGDIRFYGLLKTIGVTPRQLRRIIRYQGMFLCVIGIPVGLLLGYGVGAVLTPVVMERTTFGASASTLSASPVIFFVSALFTLITVLLSCARPGRIAAKVSPVEATKYTEIVRTRKKSRSTRGARVHQMAFANLGRNKVKTFLVVISLALSVVLLNLLVTFVAGFDMEKYLAQQTCADFIVSSTDYFRFRLGVKEYITRDRIEEIEANTDQTTAGCGYVLPGERPQSWIEEESWRMDASRFMSGEILEESLAMKSRRGDLVAENILLEGLDEELFEKLTLVEGELNPLFQENTHNIALAVDVDDYGKVSHKEFYPEVGEKLTVTYIEESYYVDSRTGEYADENTPEEFMEYYIAASHDVEYTICAYVVVPYPMGFRYGTLGYNAVLPVDRLEKDSKKAAIPMFYLFDTPDDVAESGAEEYLGRLSGGDLSGMMYESKATLRADFESFRDMFLMLGGLLCGIIGFVGVLNFLNAIMTGIFSRRREFAVLQSVGMTNRQLKAMLVYEGLFYTFSAAATAMALSVILCPLAGKLLESMFWFFSANFTVVPVLMVIPVFILLGWFIPSIMYGQTAKQSVVERLREAE